MQDDKIKFDGTLGECSPMYIKCEEILFSLYGSGCVTSIGLELPPLIDHSVSEAILTAAQDDWVRKQLRETKTLSPQQLMSITPTGCETLLDKGVQELLNKEEFQRYIPIVCALSLIEPSLALRSECFRGLLMRSLISFDETLEITSRGRECLTDPDIVARILEEGATVSTVAYIGQFGQYILRDMCMDGYEDDDAFRRHEGISDGGDLVFRNHWAFMAKKENRPFIPLVSRFSDGAAIMFCNEWIMERIADNTITFDDVALASCTGSVIMYDNAVQRLMMREENKSFIPFMMKCENSATPSALEMAWFRERIIEKRFTFEHIATIPFDVVSVFYNNKKTRDFFIDGAIYKLPLCVKEWLEKCNIIQ